MTQRTGGKPGRPLGSRQIDKIAGLVVDTTDLDDNQALDAAMVNKIGHWSESTLAGIQASDHPIPEIRLGDGPNARRRFIWRDVKEWFRERAERERRRQEERRRLQQQAEFDQSKQVRRDKAKQVEPAPKRRALVEREADQ